jgi:hypothetical protein
VIATQIVHWPGKDTAACDDHAEKLKSLGRVMGFTVSSTPCPAVMECTNCQNEAKKSAASGEGGC